MPSFCLAQAESNAHYRWVAQLWSSERLLHECRARQIAASTDPVQELPSDLSCGRHVKSVGTHKIPLRIEPDIIATTLANWSVVRRVLL
jgi:hypothetical protein